MRDVLQANNGIRGLEVCLPHEVKRAAQIFHRDGFVVVSDLLDDDQLARLRAGSARILKEILSMQGQGKRKYQTETSRLPHRYSYGTSSASRQLLHDPAWAEVVDLPTTTPILTEIFGSADYFVQGAGGDLCLPGAVEYQHLHSDLRDDNHLTVSRLELAKSIGFDVNPHEDPENIPLSVRRAIIERLPPLVTINFLMSDLTWENGPIRQIPGTHALQLPPTRIADEPEWMRLSTLVGATAGSAMFRDNRGWHGATPNLSREIRSLPDVEYGAPWLHERMFAKTMPFEVWEKLTPHGQHICRRVKADPGIWPRGAGAMHPLARDREAAKQTVTSRPSHVPPPILTF